jgi:hypothetical protein
MTSPLTVNLYGSWVCQILFWSRVVGKAKGVVPEPLFHVGQHLLFPLVFYMYFRIVSPLLSCLRQAAVGLCYKQ